MHITGIVENDHTQEVLDAMKFFLSAENKRISVTEYGYRFRNKEAWHDYWSALMHIGTEMLIVRIKPQDLEDAMNIIPLNTLIVSDYSQWEMSSAKIHQDLKNSLSQMVVILNSDVIKLSNFTDEEKYKLLCYGFSSDSIITTSSTGEPSISGQFLCCIRDSLKTANGKAIEAQEFVMNLENLTHDPYSILAAASFAVLNDIDLNRINDKH